MKKGGKGRESDPSDQKNDFRPYVVLAERLPFTLTFLIFVCEVGRLPGFRRLAYFSLCGWVDLGGS